MPGIDSELFTSGTVNLTLLKLSGRHRLRRVIYLWVNLGDSKFDTISRLFNFSIINKFEYEGFFWKTQQ